jgi:hypothetical protein
LIVVPRPLPAALLALRRTYMIVVLRPVRRPQLLSQVRGRAAQADYQTVFCGDATLPQ